MMKDKITPGLKSAMSESIKKTEESGSEQGFFMCADKDGKLSASTTKCEGNTCGIVVGIFKESCRDKKIQGFFHTHPQRLFAEAQLGRKFTKEDIKNLQITDIKGNIMTLQTPSHTDVLEALIAKCEKYTEGTVCTAADLEPDKASCWTPKKGTANFVTCRYAKRDKIHTDKYIGPKMWIKPLFNKEIINLKN
jgi:hypothetical protein